MRVYMKTLADLEKFEQGVVARTFERDLQMLLGDLYDRAGLDKSRTLTLKLELKPVADDSGGLVEVKIVVSVATSIPASKTRTVSAQATGAKGIAYNDMSPDNVNQLTIDRELERTAEND